MTAENPEHAPQVETSEEHAEMEEVVASFTDFLETKRKLKMEEIEDEEELLAAYKDLTEYQFLITHYIASQTDNIPAVKEMWHRLKEIAKSKNEGQNFSIFQRGVVTQVATHRVFAGLGFHPQFSHPRDDAFKKIDLWSDPTHAVQVKGSAHETFGIFETDEIGPAPVEISDDGKTRKLFDADLRSFKTKLKSFGADVKGYFIVIPSDKIDFMTGEPSPELIDLVRQKIGSQKKAA